jgi:hypothetical protein
MAVELRALRPGRLEPWFFSAGWYQGMYLGAAHRSHWATREPGPTMWPEANRQALLEAETISRHLLIVALTTLLAPQDQSAHLCKTVPAHVDLVALLAFLDDIVEASAAVLLAGIRVELGNAFEPATSTQSPSRRALVRLLTAEPSEGTQVSPNLLVAYADASSDQGRVMYNLACFYSALAWKYRNTYRKKRRERTLEQAAQYLASALATLPVADLQILVRWVGKDPSLRGLRELAADRFAAATRTLSRYRVPEQNRKAPR